MKILDVFVNENHEFGNRTGIIIDIEGKLNKIERQRISKENNFSETVFINSLTNPNISLYNPVREVNFAGHAVLGAAAFIDHALDVELSYINCGAGKIKVGKKDNMYIIIAGINVLPSWNLKEFENLKMLEELDPEEMSVEKHQMVWSWIDKNIGVIRARTFAGDWGIPEDEANGSGSMKLCSILKRNIKIIHGKGSVIYANYVDENNIELGGFVKFVGDE